MEEVREAYPAGLDEAKSYAVRGGGQVASYAVRGGGQGSEVRDGRSRRGVSSWPGRSKELCCERRGPGGKDLRAGSRN